MTCLCKMQICFMSQGQLTNLLGTTIVLFNGVKANMKSTLDLNQGCPCGFGQSYGRPIVRLISHFFGLAKKIDSSQRLDNFFLSTLFFFIWSRYQRVTNFQKRLTKNMLGSGQKNCNFFVVDQKKLYFFFGRPKK